MITFSEAKQIALNSIGADCALIEEAIIEKPYGWYFSPCSKEFLESGDVLIGSNGFIVDRETGRIFTFGSAYPLERDFAAYESGFKFESYDLTITSLSNRWKTVNLLHQLGMTYMMPEFQHNVMWKILRGSHRFKSIRH